MQAIILEPFNRILSGYKKVEELAVPVEACSYLCEQYQSFGVQSYLLASFQSTGYLNRYLTCTFEHLPTLVYRKIYRIPLIFRKSTNAQLLFSDSYRFEGFLLLLAWYLEHQPDKIIMDKHKTDLKNGPIYLDSAFLNFRLSEIFDGAGFPLSNFNSLEQFIEWNRIYRLINNKKVGRHTKVFDESSEENISELRTILKIVSLKYGPMSFSV
ncbi:hypothetical protein BAU15_09185 [Enterococcus sp. JM4C]|uniref:hypothetical protein n=1 Tax=Candidatus Enterococcus huntleyi TaxID=1857217 RepID=UPI00137A24B8|nr:hypothetical protein [Enterococcus sp. JM4C]KAF1296809.1 hypothetical protein BAU15_09185 [Enterococcus sp. JM4C]